DRVGSTTAYALISLQERGQLFVAPGIQVYEGMIVGETPRPQDMDVNPTRGKKLTNMRAASADATEHMAAHRRLSLEQALEFVKADECLEVTPRTVRLRKVTLSQLERRRRPSRVAGSPGHASVRSS
ncbi:MAG: translational GTPase TypA, partial [Dehalococcoidia bacterium]